MSYRQCLLLFCFKNCLVQRCQCRNAIEALSNNYSADFVLVCRLKMDKRTWNLIMGVCCYVIWLLNIVHDEESVR